MSEHPYDPVPLGEVLDGQTKRFGMARARQVGTLFAEWERIVGAAVAAHVEPVSLRKGVLKLRVDTPTWATEITYLATQIRGQVNEALGGDIVKRIEVGAGPRTIPRSEGRSRLPARDARDERDEAARPGSPDDPIGAFERARAAWLRRRAKRR